MAALLIKGATAVIEGLVSRADLNGKRVTLVTFSDGRWATRLVDGSENIRVKPANLVPYTAPVAPIGLAMFGKGSKPFTQQAWWFDEAVEKSTGTLASFKAAFLREAPVFGLSPEQVAYEQQIFDVPHIFHLAGSGKKGVQMPPAVLLMCNGMRLGISSLSPARLRVIIAVADALNALGSDVVDARAVSQALSPLGFPIPGEDHLILTVALNLPAVCDAYVYSATSDTVVAWRSTLALDPEKMRQACKTMIFKPSAEQMCCSRSVCFFCGASPLSSSVSLSLCPGCQCVAYCSEKHRRMDHTFAHNLECGCEHAFVSRAGVLVIPCHSLSISRVATEAQKQLSGKIEIEAPAESHITILREASLTGLMLPMGWQIMPA
mmetsp:Transcript_35000/g.58840  ORF Transcript_35000/g.58840 Transcript_35000/m.58840 type:complete len:378 (-) Transcript_35000:57-1190(-)|eukprot:CAMPEP_0198216520 /NCGR_PEP_ID=MMETSP1445-20131203/58074_1 /TAXON_ID=36898 /ORGANISM="Pyramimonas sp., Strain CCMP2087" /LENGTH=377 /DNA_ID=CAMNT_0043892801 /DNA_START=434 /DNA_END=1567 /DNA_ORIENTATION=+